MFVAVRCLSASARLSTIISRCPSQMAGRSAWSHSWSIVQSYQRLPNSISSDLFKRIHGQLEQQLAINTPYCPQITTLKTTANHLMMAVSWLMVSSSGTRNLVLSRTGRFFSLLDLSITNYRHKAKEGKRLLRVTQIKLHFTASYPRDGSDRNKP